MAQELPEPSLPPPLRGKFAVHSHGCRLPRLFHQGYSQKTRQHTWLSLLVVVVVVVCGVVVCGVCGVVWWWCGPDVMTMSLSIPPHERAPNWGGRTPGSQTPGVPATLGLNVQMDGGRKMLQNCSKLPLIEATMATPLLRTKMSTSSGDELNLGHFHCGNLVCMTTRTYITVDELRHEGNCCCTQRACNNLHSKRRPP